MGVSCSLRSQTKAAMILTMWARTANQTEPITAAARVLMGVSFLVT
jgi:hypothetical protein